MWIKWAKGLIQIACMKGKFVYKNMKRQVNADVMNQVPDESTDEDSVDTKRKSLLESSHRPG